MIGHTHTHYHVYIYKCPQYIYIYIQHSMIFGFGTLWRWNNKDNDYEPLDYFIVPPRIFMFRQLAQSHSDTGCFPPHQWIGSGNKIQETMFFWYFLCLTSNHGVFLCEQPLPSLLKPGISSGERPPRVASMKRCSSMWTSIHAMGITSLPCRLASKWRRNMGGEPPYGRWKIMKDTPVD